NNTPLPHNGLTKVFGGPHDFRLTILYPSWFRINRVETVRVDLAPVDPVDPVLDLKQEQPDSALPIRLTIPCAIVSAPEASLDISPFATSQAIFRVTAIAAGPLPDACLEMTRDGNCEAVALPMRAQGNGWLVGLAVLTLLVPILLFLPSQIPQW